MSESLKLRFIAQNLLSLLNQIQNNQDILKYIKYNESDSPLDEPDVNFSELFDSKIPKQIILSDVNVNIIKDSKIFVFLHPYKGRFEINDPLSNEIFVMDIVYPEIDYLIDNTEKADIRPFAIGYSFFKNIDRNDDVTGIGKIFLNSYGEGVLSTINGTGVLSLLFTIRNEALREDSV